MKKMIGMFALVGMLTLTFSTVANAESPPDNMELVYDIGKDFTMEIVPLETEKVFGVFLNVAVDTVNYKGEGGLIDVDVSNVTGETFLGYNLKNEPFSYRSPDVGFIDTGFDVFVDTGTPKNYKRNL